MELGTIGESLFTPATATSSLRIQHSVCAGYTIDVLSISSLFIILIRSAALRLLTRIEPFTKNLSSCPTRGCRDNPNRNTKRGKRVCAPSAKCCLLNALPWFPLATACSEETLYISCDNCFAALQIDSAALHLAVWRPWQGVALPMTVLLSYGFRSFHLAVGNFPCDIRKQSRGYVDAFDINASHLRLLLFFRHCFLSPFKGIVSLSVKYYSINGVLKSIVNFINFQGRRI